MQAFGGLPGKAAANRMTMSQSLQHCVFVSDVDLVSPFFLSFVSVQFFIFLLGLKTQ
jgi:hypothetical protein